MKKEDKELLRVVDLIVKKAFPQKIFLFGSRAMDTAHSRSDYDLFVLLKSGKNARKMAKELYYLMAREGIGVPIDLVVDTEDKFERLKGNHYLIYNQVDRHGKVIYEKEAPAPAMA